MSVSTPAELSTEIDSTLKAVLVQVGQSLRARSRLQSTLQLVRAKAASPLHQLSDEDLVLLQQYQGGPGQGVPGLKALEKECVRYDGLVKALGRWIGAAKDALEEEMKRATAREAEAKEAKRVEDEQREAEQVKVEAGTAQSAVGQQTSPGLAEEEKTSSAIVVDDDDDDVPLATRPANETQAQPQDQGQAQLPVSAAIDLTDDSPAGGKKLALADEMPPSASGFMPPTDPTALLASLTGAGPNTSQGNETAGGTSAMALDNFDFGQLGLQQMGGMDAFAASGQATDFQSDQLDGFNMDFLEFNAMAGDDANMGIEAGAGGMVDSSNLFGNIDFSSILGGDAAKGGKAE